MTGYSWVLLECWVEKQTSVSNFYCSWSVQCTFFQLGIEGMESTISCAIVNSP